MIDVDIAVVGGGPAGLAAALEAWKKGVRSVLVLERDKELGGILQQCIHNGFGLHYFGRELTGPEYAARFIDEINQTGIRIMTGTMALQITKDKRIFAVSAQHGLVEVNAKAIILAMGCRERTRGALNIPGTRPAGVYTAGCAQRLVNIEGYMPGKKIVILGSGDIGLIMARRMKWEGAEVKLVCEIMPYSSGLTRNVVQCLEDNEIPLRFNHTIVAVHGKERVTGVTVAKVDGNRRPIPGTEEDFACDTLLLSVGLIPENELSDDLGVTMDPVTSGAVVDERRETSVEGVFACGNVLHVHDLVDNVSREAATAGVSAADYVLSGAVSGGKRNVTAGDGVRYAVPQKLSPSSVGKAVDLYFRAGDFIRKAEIQVRCGGNVIARGKKMIVTPGEMEKITVKNCPDGDLTVSITGGEA